VDRFQNLPAELRPLQQWVLWRAEFTDEGKTTKRPYNPHTGQLASVADPATWGSFGQCADMVQANAYWSGIGFVFAEGGDYAGIDLDNKTNDPERLRFFLERIFPQFPSYTEYSPSLQGAHIIIKARVPNGKRRDSVELYSAGRFFTMTGNVMEGRPLEIAECQYHAEVLWNELGGAQERTIDLEALSTPETQSDDEVIAALGNSPTIGARSKRRLIAAH
jgi:primase-polymerase (primpol)-like protein